MPGQFEVMIERNFSSAHQLRGYKGKCENLHGHNYKIEIYARGRELDNIGLLVDFTELKRVLRGIIAGIDHQFLNDLEAFQAVNPSAENLAKYFFDQTRRGLRELPEGAGITEVIVWETDTSSAIYRPGAAGN